MSSNDSWPPPPPPPDPPQQPPTYGYAQPEYGQPPQQPPQYGYGYSPYPQQQQEGTAVAALIAAIVSWVACPVIPAIVALVLASQARQKIAASGGRLTGEGLVTAAKWIAWIHLGLVLAATLFIVLLALFSMGTSTS
jgi:hypothetical protein